MAGLSGDEWNVENEASDWTTSLIGSTTVRDTLIVSNVGLEDPMNIYKTVQAMGGFDKIDQIVAVEMQTFAVKDLQGRLWDIETQTPYKEEEKARLEQIYEDMLAANNTQEVVESTTERWNEVLGENEALAAQGLGSSIYDFENVDGGLDLRAVKLALEAQDDLSPQTVLRPRRKCFLFFCQGLRHGYISYSNNAKRDGTDQLPGDLGWSRGGSFTLPVCINGTLTGATRKRTVIGCGPTALYGLLEYKMTKGYKFFGYGNSASDRAKLADKLFAPKGYLGRPIIANYLGTCYFDGGLTTGIRFAKGTRRLLKDAGSSLKLSSNVSHYAGNVWSAPAKARILIDNVGKKNNPVIAEYFIGSKGSIGSEGHFAPVSNYAVYDSGKNGLNIKTTAHNSKWYSLSGTWGTERGIFALY